MILVFGKSGQVATALAQLPNTLCLGRDTCDLSQPGTAPKAIARHRPRAVINAAAFTAVDQSEVAEDTAHRINGTAVADMARSCAALGIPLVHISTDYVFDGRGVIPWTPADQPHPLGAYGRSKWAGEQAVRAYRGAHAILRTSWVVSAQGQNFLKTMLRLGADQRALSIVADQIGGPTPASDIAHACLTMASQLIQDPAKSGTYHFAGTPDVSWADFARAIFQQAGLPCAVTDIPTQHYPTPAPRPLNSRLDCTATQATFDIPRPDWRRGVANILKGWPHAA